jgi:hypothetical protein
MRTNPFVPNRDFIRGFVLDAATGKLAKVK